MQARESHRYLKAPRSLSSARPLLTPVEIWALGATPSIQAPFRLHSPATGGVDPCWGEPEGTRCNWATFPLKGEAVFPAWSASECEVEKVTWGIFGPSSALDSWKELLELWLCWRKKKLHQGAERSAVVGEWLPVELTDGLTDWLIVFCP